MLPGKIANVRAIALGFANYNDYLLNSPWWHAYRIKQIRNKCFACPNSNKPELMHLHHVTYDRLGEELPKDTVTLCDFCHRRLHKLIADDKATLEEAHWMMREEQQGYRAQMEFKFEDTCASPEIVELTNFLDELFEKRVDDEAA